MPLRLLPEQPAIGAFDGFSGHDIFHAEQVGDRLANIVDDIDGHSVLVIDGPWGTGKSVFVKQWAGVLRGRGHPVVYFDAFEHDHIQDAFFPLFAHLLRASTSNVPALASLRQSLTNKAISLAKAMPGILVDRAVQKATAGLVSLSDVQDALQSSDPSGPMAVEELIANEIESATLQITCVEQFRDALRDAVAGISDGDDATPPLVFVIDELDRCKPSYALNVLERIKHVFAADGICFVLVTHLEGLADMVTREYGLTRADEYLDKFFHLRFDIRSLLKTDSEESAGRYVRHLLDQYGLVGRYQGDPENAVVNLTRLHHVSLRGQQRIVLNVALLDRALAHDPTWQSYGDRSHLVQWGVGLAAMRQIEPTLYRDASLGRLEYKAMKEFFRFEQWRKNSYVPIAHVARQWTIATVGGQDALTEQESADLRDRGRPVGDAFFTRQRTFLAWLCASLDQIWQQ